MVLAAVMTAPNHLIEVQELAEPVLERGGIILEINLKHLEIRGTWGVDFSHFYRAMQFLARHGGQVGAGAGWERMISRIYTLEETNQALSDVEKGVVLKALIQPNLLNELNATQR